MWPQLTFCPLSTRAYRAAGEGGDLTPAFDHPSTQIGGELEAKLSKDGLVLAPGSSGQLDLVLGNRTSSELRERPN